MGKRVPPLEPAKLTKLKITPMVAWSFSNTQTVAPLEFGQFGRLCQFPRFILFILFKGEYFSEMSTTLGIQFGTIKYRRNKS